MFFNRKAREVREEKPFEILCDLRGLSG